MGDSQATGVDFSRDGTSVLVNSKNAGIVVLDSRNFKAVRTIGGHINTCAWARAKFSPDGQYIVAGSSMRDKATGLYPLLIWRVKTGEVIQRIPAHQAPVVFWDWHGTAGIMSCD